MLCFSVCVVDIGGTSCCMEGVRLAFLQKVTFCVLILKICIQIQHWLSCLFYSATFTASSLQTSLFNHLPFSSQAHLYFLLTSYYSLTSLLLFLFSLFAFIITNNFSSFFFSFSPIQFTGPFFYFTSCSQTGTASYDDFFSRNCLNDVIFFFFNIPELVTSTLD